MTPQHRAIALNDIDLSYFEWKGDGESEGDSDQPAMVFAHATGFHARVWDAIIAHFKDRHIYSLDMRGHGRSTGGPITHWRQFSQDVCGFVDATGLKGAIGIGHSMGAHTLLQAAADRPDAFSRLILFDPVILAPEFYSDEAAWFSPDHPHPASKRKREFASPEAMIDRFADREPYSLFDRRVFEDYCRHGLLPQAGGERFELACAPEVEASVYESSRTNAGIHETARSVKVPTLIVRAQQTQRMDFKGSPTWPPLASTMPQGQDMPRPDMTHFHPFQDPADAARIISDWIDTT